MRRILAAAAPLIAAALVAGCVGAPAAPGSGGELPVLRIAAAASLQAAFDRIGEAFEAAHPDIALAPMSFDGSSTIITQLIEGAPYDIIATADEPSMQRAVEAGVIADPQIFASNTLVLVTTVEHAADIASVAALARPELDVVLCAPEVPCGRATSALLDLHRISVSPVSLEQSVAGVLAKVASREADAGLVYATDAAASGDVISVPVDHADAVVNRYPIAVTSHAREADAARAFADFVLGPEGQAILAELGFGSGS